MVPFADSRSRKDRLAALEEGTDCGERGESLDTAQFVQRLENSMVKEPMLLTLISRHLRTRAFNFLGKRFVSGVEDS